MITKYWGTISQTNMCSSVQDHKIYLSSIEQVWKHLKHKRSSKTLVEDLKEGQPEVNTLDQKKRTPLQKLKRAPNSEVLAGHRRPHQTRKTFRLQKHLRDPDSMSTLSSSVAVHIKGFEHSFVFFWPRVETDKGYFLFQQRIFKWLSNIIIHIVNGSTSLIWSFSTTLYALTLFSNVSQIHVYIRSWRPWRRLTILILCYFNCVITLSN